MFAISLFHGRSTPNEQLDDWGFDGPLLINVGVGWTYGSIKLLEFNDAGQCIDMVVLPIHDNMVMFDDNYYGDFEIVPMSDPIALNADRVRLTFSQIKKIIEG